MITSSRFGVDWEAAEPRVRRFLGSLGAGGYAMDDLVQEVAARALATGLVYDSVDELVRWGCTVARNLMISEQRHNARLCPAGDAEVPTAVSTDSAALGRLEVEQTLQAISRLSPRDQEALLGQLRPPGRARGRDRRADVRSNVALFRARNRLLQLLAGAVAVVLARAARWRNGAGRAGVAIAAAGVAIPLTIATLRHDGGRAPAPAVAPGEVTAAWAHADALSARPAAAAVFTAPATARPRGASVESGRSATTPRRAPKAVVPTPRTEVVATTPVGRHRTTVRDKEPDDHLVCVEAYLVIPRLCAG